MRSGDSMTRAIGQSSARWQVLGRTGYQAQTVAQIARDMGHARQSVQRIADVLVKEGLAIYRDNPADRRAQLLELTEQGVETLMAINALNDAWAQRIITSIDQEQLDTVNEALENLAQIFEADEHDMQKKKGSS